MDTASISQLTKKVATTLYQHNFLPSPNPNLLKRLNGWTNFTFEFLDKNEQKRVARWTDSSCSIFIDREAEKRAILCLQRHNLYPKILFYSSQLKVEEFVSNNGICSNRDLLTNPNLLQNIYNNLEKIYVHIERDQAARPDQSETKIIKFIKNLSRTKKNILSNLEGKISLGDFNTFSEILSELENFSDELVILHGFIESEVRFCHGDLNPFNFLKIGEKNSNKENEILMIDYEYSGWNYPLYDLANIVHEVQSQWDQKMSIKDFEAPELKNGIDMIIEEGRKALAGYSSRYDEKEFRELVLGFRAFNFFFWTCLTISIAFKSEKLGVDLKHCALERFKAMKESVNILRRIYGPKMREARLGYCHEDRYVAEELERFFF